MSLNQTRNKLVNFLGSPFTLLDSKRDKLFLIIFCGIFATFFINFYEPLNISTWNHDSAIGNFLTIWTAGIIGAIVLSITQFILRPLAHLNTFNIGRFVFWVLFEFFLIALLMFILYGESVFSFWKEFFLVFRYTISLTIIPYFLACLIIAVKKLSNPTKIKEAPAILKPILKSTPPLAQHAFKDENGKIMLAIKPTQLLLLKSENNYTSVFFLQNEQVEKKLIRTNLKKLESELTEFPYLLRIHRSYMVNLENIASVQRKKGSFQISLTQLPEMPLKVSETYKAFFELQIKD